LTSKIFPGASQKDAEERGRRISRHARGLLDAIVPATPLILRVMSKNDHTTRRLDKLVTDLCWMAALSSNFKELRDIRALPILVGALSNTYHSATGVPATVSVDPVTSEVKGTLLPFFQAATRGLFLKAISGDKVRRPQRDWQEFLWKGKKPPKIPKTYLLKKTTPLGTNASRAAGGEHAEKEKPIRSRTDAARPGHRKRGGPASRR
jgi:hypothetical protein